jgi:hypothetical protein
MTKILSLLTPLAIALASLLFSAPAQAQRDRVFVASYGNDNNPCTFGSPCKTFQNAYGVVAPGGEVTAIDSAGFGPLFITKAVTITSPDGIEAGIATPAGQTAIEINAQSTDTVTLHGLTIDGAKTATDGIKFLGGGSLIVTNCIIRQFTSHGMLLTAASPVTLTDSVIASNPQYGVFAAPVGAGGTFTFDHVRFIANNDAMSFQDANLSNTNVFLKASGSDSLATGNAIGFDAIGTEDQDLYLGLDNVRVENNGTGIRSRGAIIDLSRSMIGINTIGWSIESDGVIQSYGNNIIADFNTNGSLTTTPNPVQ